MPAQRLKRTYIYTYIHVQTCMHIYIHTSMHAKANAYKAKHFEQTQFFLTYFTNSQKPIENKNCLKVMISYTANCTAESAKQG